MSPARGTVSVLRRLLLAAGYRLEDRPVGLRAFRSRDRRVVVLVDGNRSPTEVEPEFPADAVHRMLVYADDPGTLARSLASERGIEILDPTTLGSVLGEILLPPMMSESSATAAEEDDEMPIDPPAAIFPEGERTVRPRLSQQDAESIAGVEGFRFTLRLIPFVIAPYRVRVPSPHGGPGATSDHLVAVNALSGHVEFWEAGERELVAEVEEPHQRLEPQVPETQLRSAAESAVRKRHTVSVDHTEQHGGAIVIERRRVPPGPDDLKLGPSVLVHVPFWYVESAEGRVVIDAVTGTRSTPDDREALFNG